MTLTIGLTGGIASGKSTVSHLFSKFNVPIIDADIISHELTTNNATVISKINNYFASNHLVNDGKLNRLALKKIIFSNAKAKTWLENLLHPLIRAEILVQKKKYIDQSYIIIVIPLLLETKAYPFIDRSLVVDIDPKIQRQRVAARDNLSEEIITNILNSQVTRSERLTNATDTIINNGNFAQLEIKVKHWHEFYLNLASTLL